MKKLSLKALELGATEILSRAQMKNVLGGINAPAGCGTGISCDGKMEFESCGTKECGCITVPDGGNMYYCRSDA
jgi:hypothetical protein